VGWTEFVWFLRYDAWTFFPQHVLGIQILGVTLEDWIFCPCFSIIFYWIYHKTRLRFQQRVFNPTDKMVFFLIAFAVCLTYYDIGSQFSKYMALRAGLGFIGMIYCWNYASFRHCSLFLIIVYIVGFGWDLPSVANEIWVYVKAGQPAPKIYDGLTFKILSAEFPIELFGYYFTGGFFSFWTISFFKKYFEGQHKQKFELYTKVERRDVSNDIKKLEPDKRIINLVEKEKINIQDTWLSEPGVVPKDEWDKLETITIDRGENKQWDAKKSKHHSPFDDIKDVPDKRIRNADDIRHAHAAREEKYGMANIGFNIKGRKTDLNGEKKEWDAKEKAVKKEVKGSK
jgi:hypothetical protein